MKMKAFTIYLTPDEYVFLKQKTQEGYKASSFIRFLLLQEIKKEQRSDKNDA